MNNRKWLNHTISRALLAVVLVGAQQTVSAEDAAALHPEALRAYMHLVGDKKEGAQRWEKMTPEQRIRARERYEHFKQLPPEEQARIRERYEHFHQLSPEQRHELREQWDKMSPEERRKAINKKHRKRHSHEE